MSETAKTKGGCVICGKPKVEQFKPFCSKRCAEVDLNRWFSGGYSIAGDSAGDEAEDKPLDPRDKE